MRSWREAPVSRIPELPPPPFFQTGLVTLQLLFSLAPYLSSHAFASPPPPSADFEVRRFVRK